MMAAETQQPPPTQQQQQQNNTSTSGNNSSSSGSGSVPPGGKHGLPNGIIDNKDSRQDIGSGKGVGVGVGGPDEFRNHLNHVGSGGGGGKNPNNNGEGPPVIDYPAHYAPPPPPAGAHYPQQPPPSHHHQQQLHPQQHHLQQQQQPHPQDPYYAQQHLQHRFPGKPLPGGGPPQGGQYPPSGMRGGYPPLPSSANQPPSGPTPTLNELLKSSNSVSGGNSNNSNSSNNSNTNNLNNNAPLQQPPSNYRYPPNTYEQQPNYGPPIPQQQQQQQHHGPHGGAPPPHHIKSDYPPGPPPSASNWPPPHQQQQQQQRPPPVVNSYGHPQQPLPPPQHHQQQPPPQSMYRQGGPSGPVRPGGGVQMPPHPQQGYYPSQQQQQQQGQPSYPPGPPHSPHYPPPPQQQQPPPQSSPSQHPLHPSSAQQRYPPPPGARPGEGGVNHSPSQQQQQQHYNLPPSSSDGQHLQSSNSLSNNSTTPSTSTASANNNNNGPGSELPAAGAAASAAAPPSGSNNSISNSSGGAGGGPSGSHRPKSTPPPPQSPSHQQQQQQQHSNLPNHHQPPQSPSQSPRTTSAGSIVNNSNSLQHRPPPSQQQQQHYSAQQPPDVGDCNSNDSVGAGGGGNSGGMRASPTGSGSASSRSMSPAVGNPNIPMPPRPSSSQSDGQRQSPMPPGGQYPQQQQSMAPPPHHMYPTGGKLSHHSGQMIPPSGPPPSQGHYPPPPHQQQHWPNQPSPQGYQQGRPGPAQHPQQQQQQQHGGVGIPGYPSQPLPQQAPNQPGMPPNPNYGPGPPQQQQSSRHGPGPPPPGPGQYGNYPPPQYGGPLPHWAIPQPNASHASSAPNPNVRSQTPQHYQHSVKQHLQQKLTGFPSPPHQGSYPMGPPSSTPPPQQQYVGGGGAHLPPPNLLPHSSPHDNVEGMDTSSNLIGPDGTPLDDASQHSTASGASGGDDGSAKIKRDSNHPNYHPSTPQTAVPSPGAASLNSMHDEYGDGNSPGGWPRTPASPVLNSHPPSSSDQFRSKAKKPDSMTKLFEMDSNPDRRMFLDKLLHYMDEHGTPITACPTISKNALDLFKLYFSVKDRGGFLEVTKSKAWKDVAGILGIGASSSAAYTLRKHYTKHLLPFECKFDRGGIDPTPLISQVEATTKKKGSKAAPVPSPGSSNSQDSFQGGQPNTGTPALTNNNSNSNSTPNSSMDGFPPMYPSGPYGSQPPPSQQQQQQQNEYPPSNSNAPPAGPPTQRGAPPAAGPNLNQSQHAGDKIISLSNPFDDMHPANSQQQYQTPSGSRANYYSPYSTPPVPSSGYQGGPPPGNYPPYSIPPGDQYSRGPPVPHDYNHQQPPYGAQQTPGGYPVPPQQGRAMYPYGSTEGQQQQQQPPTASPQQQIPPSSQGQPPPGSGEDQHQRYVMVPPQSNYPGHPPGSSSGRPPFPAPQGQVPPPNGYPNQEFYQPEQFPSSSSTNKSSRQSPPELSTLKSTLQGYLQMPGHPPGGQSPGSNKQMPPPHPNQRRMDYPLPHQQMPPHGKEQVLPPQGYPGYPQQSPQQAQASRMPPYDGSNQGQMGRGGGFMYPPNAPTGARDPQGPNIPQIRSSPSPSPNTANATAKPWIPPPSEGWPNNTVPYSQQPQRPYGALASGPPGHPQQPTGSTTPIPPSQSPIPPVPSPQQVPSPQPWNQQRGGPPPQQGPPAWTHSGGGVVSNQIPPNIPQGPSGSHGQVWPPQSHQRNSPRPPFPSMKPEMYKGYPPPPGAMIPPNSGPQMQNSKQNSMLSSQLSPINQMSSSIALSNSQMSAVPQPTPFVQIPCGGPPPIHIKKEIVFPPESVEAVVPVLTRRKKLHKNDVAPVEPWRIMMCLKSGLLAETTWALDVLNVLLYDDNSITYFSLTYLPGLLDLILEHLRRSLVLVFGQSVGLDVGTDKDDNIRIRPKRKKWYEPIENSDDDVDKEVDIGTPLMKYPRNGSRTVVLSGPNYTLKSRITQKEVGILAKDDEPFVVPGPRDWDIDEKIRTEPNVCPMSHLNNANTMDLTRHVISNFTSDLNIVPIVNVLRKKEQMVICAEETVIIKSEPTDNDNNTVPAAALNLDLYNCETKYASDFPTTIPTPAKKLPNNNNHKRANSCTSSATVTSNEDSSSVQNNWMLDGNSLLKSDTKINCQIPNIFKGKIARGKGKKLDSIVNRIKNKDMKMETDEDDEAMKLMMTSAATKSKEVLANSCSDNAVMMDQATGKVEDNSNQSAPINHTDNSSSDNVTCDNSTKSNPMTNSCDILSKHTELQQSQLAPTPIVIVTAADNEISAESASASQSSTNCTGTQSRTYGSCIKRRRLDEYEDECYTRDEASLYNVTESQDSLARRTLAICNILRNLTFVPGNDAEIGKNQQFLSLLGKLILLHHDHPLKGKKATGPETTAEDEPKRLINNNNILCIKDDAGSSAEAGILPTEDNGIGGPESSDDGLFNLGAGSITAAAATVTAPITADVDSESCTSLNSDGDWWWEYIHHVRENVLVIIANISGQIDLSLYSEEISRPILDGLLHWAICPAAYGQDPFPSINPNSNSILTPQRLAIEALCKLCVTQGNVDLLLATPPYSRIEKLCQLLSRWLCRSEEQVLREFSVNLLSYLSGADSGIARTIAQQNPCISLLISFIEQAEANAMNIANNHGFAMLRENPEAMGTSLDMLRRAANTLLNLAKHPDNRALFVQHEPRLLNLVMSQILEQKVAALVAQVLFQCSSPDALHSGMMSTGINDCFYTPSLSRSRSIHNPTQQHVVVNSSQNPISSSAS